MELSSRPQPCWRLWLRFCQGHRGDGYDEAWIVEDCFLSGAPTLAATALAMNERLRFGIGLLPATIRNPALTATGSPLWRVCIPIGYGRLRSRRRSLDAADRGSADVPHHRSLRGRQLGRASLAGETVTVTWSWAHRDVIALGRPPDVPPEILVGTAVARGVRVAAEQADGVLLPEGCSPRMLLPNTAGSLKVLPWSKRDRRD